MAEKKKPHLKYFPPGLEEAEKNSSRSGLAGQEWQIRKKLTKWEN